MKRARYLNQGLLGLALLGLAMLAAALDTQAAAAIDPSTLQSRTGLIVSSDGRFDPLVQRMIARRDLLALPIAHSQLFILVPAQRDGYHEQAQIQYLETMLRERAARRDGDSQ